LTSSSGILWESKRWTVQVSRYYPGEFVAIVGQNGAGKTTLTRHFNGLAQTFGRGYPPFGKSVLDEPTASLCATVGYVFQNPDEQLFCDTVEDELRFGPMNIGMDKDRMEESVRDILLDIGLDKYRPSMASVTAY